MHYQLLARLLILLAVANGAPVIAKRIFGERYSQPLDWAAPFIDGKPVFGPSKTIRGILSAIIATTASGPLLGLKAEIGGLIAVAAMTGDLFSSFIKRRFGSAPSSQALGLDQIPKFAPATGCLQFYPSDKHRGYFYRYCALFRR